MSWFKPRLNTGHCSITDVLFKMIWIECTGGRQGARACCTHVGMSSGVRCRQLGTFFQPWSPSMSSDPLLVCWLEETLHKVMVVIALQLHDQKYPTGIWGPCEGICALCLYCEILIRTGLGVCSFFESQQKLKKIFFSSSINVTFQIIITNVNGFIHLLLDGSWDQMRK